MLKRKKLLRMSPSYSTTIKVQNQEFKVLIDLQSSGLWLPDRQCILDPDSVCATVLNKARTGFVPAFYDTSSQAGKRNATSLTVKGLGGTVLGYSVEDTIALESSTKGAASLPSLSKTVKFISGYSIPEGFEWFAEQGFQGYLGLGIYAPPDFGKDSVLAQLYKQSSWTDGSFFFTQVAAPASSAFSDSVSGAAGALTAASTIPSYDLNIVNQDGGLSGKLYAGKDPNWVSVCPITDMWVVLADDVQVDGKATQ